MSSQIHPCFPSHGTLALVVKQPSIDQLDHKSSEMNAWRSSSCSKGEVFSTLELNKNGHFIYSQVSERQSEDDSLGVVHIYDGSIHYERVVGELSEMLTHGKK